jgi:hypothetical protein
VMSERVSFSLKNDREEELPIFVEPWPEFYKLKGEALTVVLIALERALRSSLRRGSHTFSQLRRRS